jgi:hypothetical protein
MTTCVDDGDVHDAAGCRFVLTTGASVSLHDVHPANGADGFHCQNRAARPSEHVAHQRPEPSPSSEACRALSRLDTAAPHPSRRSMIHFASTGFHPCPGAHPLQPPRKLRCSRPTLLVRVIVRCSLCCRPNVRVVVVLIRVDSNRPLRLTVPHFARAFS